MLALGAAVGLLSSVIPYSLELTALRTMPPRVFSILMSLEPAAAALAGVLVLHELLTPRPAGRDGLRRRGEHRRDPASRCRPVPAEPVARLAPLTAPVHAIVTTA